MYKRTAAIATALALALALPVAVRAQSGLRQVPLGYCYASSPSSPANLTSMIASSTTCTAPNIAAATYAVICAYTQGIVYKDDGQAPTGTPGTGGAGLAAGGCEPYNGTISALQFIEQASGAIVGVQLYK